MIDNYQNWDSSYISGKQLFAGFGLIIVGCTLIITDIAIIIRDLKKK